MRVKSSGVVITILGQNIILNAYAINDLHEFLTQKNFKYRHIWFAIDKNGQLYCYNHEPFNHRNEEAFSCGNGDDQHCEGLMCLDVEWNYDLEWKGAHKAVLLEDIMHNINEYYENRNGDV